MDLSWILTGSAIVASCIVGSFVGGLVIGAVKNWKMDMDVASHEARIKRLEMALISGQGVDARRDKAERMSSAMAEVAAAMANPENKGKEGEIIKSVAAKYPDVALTVASKFMKQGGFGDLGKGLGQWIK